MMEIMLAGEVITVMIPIMMPMIKRIMLTAQAQPLPFHKPHPTAITTIPMINIIIPSGYEGLLRGELFKWQNFLL